MEYDASRALQLLRAGVGQPDTKFRDGQEAAIRQIVEAPGRSLLVERTGWGKSFVYFIAARLLREAGTGPTLLVSPLLSLMRNQIDAAERMGVAAETINSSNPDLWPSIVARIQADEVDILLISPERLASEQFRNEVLTEIGGRVALLVVDEAHCISDWGHDFRPDYRRIARLIPLFPRNLRVLATTATANRRVVHDLEEALGPNLRVQRGDLARPSLSLQTIRMPSRARRMAWIAQRLSEIDGSGIIYVLTVRDALQLADWLRYRGFNVHAYTGSLESDERVRLERSLLENEVKALVATTALGMGFDKPDLRFVIHYQVPQSVIHYYQQVGRAGRGVDQAYGVLLGGWEDLNIQDYFIHSAFPTRDEAGQVLNALERASEGLSIGGLEALVNVRRGRLDQTLRILALESPATVVRDGGVWRRTVVPLEPSFWQRVERITALRQAEQSQMQDYLDLQEGHMAFLLAALDNDLPSTVGPNLPPLSEDVDPRVLQLAIDFLAGLRLEIEPRKRWPPGQGSIPIERRASLGRALSQWGDEGLAERVRQEKYEIGEFSEQLVDAAARLIREWDPQPKPTWVTCIPSDRRPTLVPSLASRLADTLNLPFSPVLSRSKPTAEQKTMANSTHQARNARDSLEIDQGATRRGPVLLVDDMVDSRWTMAAGADLLRSYGSGEVFPFALARVGG
ncbi:MAG: RecQ family ATP-dependent DNA helicase [Chloroflexi bacterium]|nr:RecQ family ATP-dependent DNA helicase [Chloroflexota bacterium]MCY3696686.1 RecQ family ATP-dependent DNA helicase [Chloroflexota bacterium]